MSARANRLHQIAVGSHARLYCGCIVRRWGESSTPNMIQTEMRSRCPLGHRGERDDLHRNALVEPQDFLDAMEKIQQ